MSKSTPQVPKLVRQTADMIDTTARCGDNCQSCNGHIYCGDRVTTVSSMGAASLVAGGLPHVIQCIIARTIGDVEEIHHADCAGSSKITKSGRISRPPVRLVDEKFTAGSGFSGCDHYDPGYDNGVFCENDQSYKLSSELTGFVIPDDQPVEPSELSEDEEEWSDYSSSDEEGEWEEDFSHIEKAIAENRVKVERGSN